MICVKFTFSMKHINMFKKKYTTMTTITTDFQMKSLYKHFAQLNFERS